ncbi:GIY-YIG nuclease family protein, partial [Candidatus Falkowbacteria bacterium]|nr:GIY-YIG nuclease family protein [Candidatus Falkowbacteria bacterium]
KKFNKFYIGCSSNLELRIEQHNGGKTKSTKPFRPWELVYYEKFNNKKMAYKREWHLKHPAGYLEKLMIIKRSSQREAFGS